MLLYVKVLLLSKIADFLQRNADISKIKRALVLKGKFSKTAYMCITYVPNFKFIADEETG